MNQPVINIKRLTVNVAPGLHPFGPLQAALAMAVGRAAANAELGDQERYFLTDGGLTITDRKTGRVWDAEEREFPNADAAEAYVKTMTLAGHSDWIIPDDMLLQTIVDRSRREPACNPIFKSKGGWVLTSTPYKLDKNKPAGSSGLVWVVYFSSGGVGSGYRGDRCFVRAVRSVAPAGQ